MKNYNKIFLVFASVVLTSGLIGCKTKNNTTSSLISSSDSPVSSEQGSNTLFSDEVTSSETSTSTLITTSDASSDNTSDATTSDASSDNTSDATTSDASSDNTSNATTSDASSDNTSNATSSDTSIDITSCTSSDTSNTSELSSEFSSNISSSESISHTFSEWTITIEPTLTNGGIATRHWIDDPTHVETENIPNLADSSVWSVSESVKETNYEDGYTTYNSKYGSVTITSVKKYGNWEFKDSNLVFGSQTTLVKKSNVGLDDIEKTVALPNHFVKIDVTTGDFEKYKLEQGSDYYFVEKDGVFTSNNKGIDSSISSMIFTPKVNGIISYSVFCSSEKNYDYFYDSISPTVKIGDEKGQTEKITRQLNANETFTFNYKKDNGESEGDDQAIISNIKFEVLDLSPATKDDFAIIDYTDNGEILDPMVILKDSKVELFDYKKDGYILDGWYYDKTLTNRYTDETIFKEYTVLHAKLVESYKVTLVLNNGKKNLEYYFKKGEKIILDNPSLEGYVFVGWYTTINFEEGSQFNPEISYQDDVVLYAKYDKAPDYVGKYTTKEVYNESNFAAVFNNLEIDENGKITNFGSSNKLDKVISFDKETGRIECEIDGIPSFMYYYDGIIIAPTTPSTSSFGKEIIIGAKKSFSKFGQYSFKDANGNFTTKFIGFVSDNKTYYFGIINDKVYTDLDFQISNIEDKSIDLTSISSYTSSKLNSFIVKDSLGNILLAKGKDYNTWIDLEAPFGTYSNNEFTITLNGMGNYSDSNGKNGRYVLLENNIVGVTIGFGENVSEYFEFTLNGDSFTYEKPMVTITFNTGEGHEIIEPLEVNKNVPIVLENANDEEDYIFEGWYIDPAHRLKIIDKYTPISDITIYAKYVEAIKLYVYENNDFTSEPYEKKYKMNDVVIVDEPSKFGYIFAGWYTTSTFEPGSEWENGSIITQNTSIYAKYDMAEPYVGNYTGVYIKGNDDTGGISTFGIESLSINSKLTGSFTGDNASFKFDEDDKTRLVIEKYRSVSYSNTYNGWWNENDKLLVAISSTTKSAVYLFSGNGDTDISASVKASYWNGGETRIISYTDPKNQNHIIFIYDGNVYFNVKVFDAINNEISDVTTVYSLDSTTIVTENLKFRFVSSDTGLVLDKAEENNINLNISYNMQNIYHGFSGSSSLSLEIVATNGNRINVPELDSGDVKDNEFIIIGDINKK